MSYEIEKDIPIPQGKGRKRLYPFAELSPGESFLVPTEDKIPASTIRNAASQAKKKLSRQFVVATVSNGVRVWRTDDC